MQKNLKYIISQFREDESSLNKIIVSLFVKSNSITVKNNVLIKSLLITEKSNLSKLLSELIIVPFSFDNIIEAFELSIPTNERIINGAVYTPTFIKDFIIESSLKKVQKPISSILAGDISCGCGGFLFTLANKIKAETGKSFSKIFEENLYGLDICNNSIQRTKILLSLLALSIGEDKIDFKFNLFTANALSFDWLTKVKRIKSNSGFDLIVGNPPYVRAKNIDTTSKSMLSNWTVTKSGNPDLYIPFFEIGLRYLNNNGVLGYITVNSFYKSVNARELRKYLQTQKYSLSIIDFGHEKIFGSKSAYTCICIISKNHSNTLSYKKETAISLAKHGMEFFNSIFYKDLNYKTGWLLNNKLIVENIKKIEAAGTTLGEKYVIKNGIATLNNDIYIFKPIEEMEDFFILFRDGKKFKIEKSICRDVIKPNILKSEKDIDSIKEKLIYPYTNGITPLSLIDEKRFKKDFPEAYKYLSYYKEELSNRDKGNGDYAAWYAFGRTQALGDKGYKLMFPYMAKTPHFIFTDNKEMLIYCGYAIFHESAEELKLLKRILESKVFEYYISNTSKPYSAGYLSYAKNYVKNFGICNLNDKERHFISSGTSKKEINDFLIKKYKIII